MKRIAPRGADVDWAKDARAFREHLVENAYHGLLLDMRSKIALRRSGESLHIDSLSAIPQVSLKWDHGQEMIRTVYIKAPAGTEPLTAFLSTCKRQPPRRLRTNKRYAVNLNVLLSAHPDMSDPEMSMTVDVSRSGAFIFSGRSWVEDQRVWIDVPLIDEISRLEGTVVWSRPWGADHEVPGIGVGFASIPEEVAEAIVAEVRRTLSGR